MYVTDVVNRGVIRGGRGVGDLPCPFSKIRKKCPNLERNALTVVISE